VVEGVVYAKEVSDAIIHNCYSHVQIT